MRRRKPAGGDDETLSQPLLSEDADSADAPREPSAGADDDASPPFDLLGALHEFFLRLFASLGLCQRTPPPLTEAQKLRLARLARRVDVPYDATNVDHARQLRELWSLTFPDREDALPRDPDGSESLKHEGWKSMGWQGVDPATDFRSGGLLSLQNLVWFAKNRRETYDSLLKKKNGTRSAWEYPFAAAGVNVTFALVDLLELRATKAVSSGAGVVLGDDAHVRSSELSTSKAVAPRAPAAVAFLDMLDPGSNEEEDDERETRETRVAKKSSKKESDPDVAFERLYVCFWEVFDNEWLDQKASYMEFSSVMESTKERVRLALEKAGKQRGGCTLEGVRDALGLDATDA